jgi:hypothetical protein
MKTMINPRVFAFLAIIGVFIFLAFGGNILFPKKDTTKNETQMIVVERTVEKLVTPTPDGHIYFASEYQNGTRLLKRPFTFIRYNALYKQDMKVTTIVYDYKFFEKLHWFNPTTYKYQEQLPDEGTKFCFIFVTVFMDDIGGDDTRMWAFNRSYFGLYDGANMNYPFYYPFQIRYRELEQTPTFDNTGYVEAFKQKRLYNNEEFAVKTAGEISDETYYLRGGISNAIDGYLLFQIPNQTPIENLIVFGDFSSFGFSRWRLSY